MTVIFRAILMAIACLCIGTVVASPTANRATAKAASGQALTAEQGDAILAELKVIRAMLEEDRRNAADAATGTVRIPDSALTALGSENAPVTLVEYTDYQCPFCRRFHEQSWPEIKKDYIDTGKVRLIVRDLPLDFHDQAMPSAVAARCAGQQGRYWPMYEMLLSQTEPLTKDSARRLAAKTGVDAAAFDQCLRDPAIRRAIDSDMAEAQRIGVTGTPGFLIAQRREGQLEGSLVLGAQPTAAFTSRIDALLGAH